MRAKIEGAVEYLNANPVEARYTDSYAIARLDDPAGLRVEVEGPDSAAITTDMPASVGGTSSAASPGWYLRAAVASCVATLIAMRAASVSVHLQGIEVTVDSESDDRGILGADDGVPGGPLSTRVSARLRAVGADERSLREILDWAVEHCPVSDALRRAIPMTVELDASE